MHPAHAGLKFWMEIRHNRVMNKRTRRKPEDTRSWSAPLGGEDPPEAGYDAAVRVAVAEGLDDKGAGRVKPAGQVWKELGLE